MMEEIDYDRWLSFQTTNTIPKQMKNKIQIMTADNLYKSCTISIQIQFLHKQQDTYKYELSSTQSSV